MKNDEICWLRSAVVRGVIVAGVLFAFIAALVAIVLIFEWFYGMTGAEYISDLISGIVFRV